MKIILISILLFFELTSGLNIPKTLIEVSPQENKTDENTKTDVYKIQESDNKAIRIIYPRAEKPTLREIIYYHVIETPYENYGSQDINKEGPDFDQTRRPFTNSHGFQFMPEDPEKIDYTKNEVTSDINSNETMPDEDVYDDDVDMRSFLTEDSEEEAVTTEIIEIGDSSNETTERTKKIQEVETDDDVALQIEDDTDNQETYSQNSNKAMNVSKDTFKTDTTTPLLETTASWINMEDLEVTTLKTDDVVEEKKNARNLLFNQVRNKYQNFKRPAKPVERPKRHVLASGMPEAPTLPPLNLNALLENFRKVIPTPKPIKNSPNSQEELTTFNDEDQDFKEEIEKKIGAMIASLKPKDGDDIHENDEHEVKNKRVPRTFGMNLTNDQGYVWNDLWTEPGISFDVGESVEDVLEDKKEETEKSNVVTFPEILHPTESRPMYTDSDENSKHEMSIAENEDRESNNGELEDIFVNMNKPTVIAENNIPKKEETEKQIEATTAKHNNEETLTKEIITAAPSDNKTDEDKCSADKEVQIEEKAISDKPDLLQELMKNEQFWKWLGDWTATYMELLMKHVKNIVHEEVARQMKKQVSKLKDDLINEIKIKSDFKEKDPEFTNIEKKMDADDKSAKHENKLVELPKNETADSKTTNNNTHASEVDCSQEKIKADKPVKQPIFSNDKSNINGKEIPITHSSNLDDNLEENKETMSILKHRKDKDGNKFPILSDNFNKTNDKATVTAKNIFGNTVGVEKVTNIFIFSKDSEQNDLINDLVSESQNLLSFKPNKKDNITNPEITGQKDESTMTEPENIPINLQETDSEAHDKINNEEKEDKKVESATSIPDTIITNTKNPIESNHNQEGDTIKENTPDKENTQDVAENTITDKQKDLPDNANTSEKAIDATTESVNKVEDEIKLPEENKPNTENIQDVGESTNADKQKEATDNANTSTSENPVAVTTESTNKVEDKIILPEENKPHNENIQDDEDKQKESTDNANTSASENPIDGTAESVNKVEEKNI